MVRVNLILPKNLSDQHLIAEYNEMLMLVSYIKKYPKLENIPKNYTLGKGHMTFFKNKLTYLEKRHKKIKAEMKRRRFATNKSLDSSSLTPEHKKNYFPKDKDFQVIKARLIEKLNKKPDYYRYRSKTKGKDFFISLIRKL